MIVRVLVEHLVCKLVKRRMEGCKLVLRQGLPCVRCTRALSLHQLNFIFASTNTSVSPRFIHFASHTFSCFSFFVSSFFPPPSPYLSPHIAVILLYLEYKRNDTINQEFRFYRLSSLTITLIQFSIYSESLRSHVQQCNLRFSSSLSECSILFGRYRPRILYPIGAAL